MVADAKPGLDFFISHATVNRAWAEWIAVELETAGYTTIVQSFDFRPGTDFLHQMQKASATAERTIAVLSPAYLTSRFGEAEWRAAFAKDPDGEKGLLIPVRVQPGDPIGLLATRVYVDLVGTTEPVARRKLLAAVDRNRPRPTTAPFPGTGLPVAEQTGPGLAPSSTDRDASRPSFPGSGVAVSNLPRRNRTFTGRRDVLLKIYTGLQEQAAAAVLPTTAVHGLGGVGKTHLAIEYAHRYVSDYDFVWWINAERPTTVTTALVTLGRRLGLPEIADQTEAVEQLFDQLRTRNRWLLIYDNAESPVNLHGLVPEGGGGHVLVTSRWSAWATRTASIPLDVLTRQESFELLQRIHPTESQHSAALSDLADLLGDLPLALEEAAAYLDATHTSPDDYLTLIRDRARELFGLDHPGHDSAPAHRDQRRVATVWTLSLDAIREQVPAAEGLLALLAFLAFLAPEAVPRTLPTTHPGLLPEPLQTAAADPITYNQVIAAVGRYSLATASPVDLGMHRLVQTVVRARLSPDDEHAWATAAVDLISRTFTDEIWEVQNWTDCERLLPHLLAVTTHAHHLGVAGQQVGRLLNRASIYLHERGRYQQAKSLAEQALTITQATLGNDHIDVAWRHDTFGSALLSLSDLTGARHHHERALAICETAYGTDHDNVAVLHGGLGAVLRAQGDLFGARLHFQEALRIGELNLAPNDIEIGARCNNLGLVLHDLFDLDGARHYYARALHISQAALGPDHPDIGAMRNNLGRVLRALGYPADARDQLEQALRIGEAALGPDHPTIGIRRNNLGFVLRDLGDLNGARHQLERALRISEAALGTNHIRVREIRAIIADLDSPEEDQPPPGRPPTTSTE